MRVIGAADVAGALDYGELIERLRGMFRQGCAAPVRHHHTVPDLSFPDARDATLLLMPAWQAGKSIGIKMVTVFPENATRSLPTIMGAYLLLDGRTGALQALIDGPSLTVKRTAAASALAAAYLARNDASRLLMVGTGTLAPELILAHCQVRPIKEVLVWGRNPEKAERLAKRLQLPRGISIRATDDLPGAVAGADIVSAATLARDPIVLGEWLEPGVHLDLVGGFTPQMREVDDEAIRRARVFVDTRDGACKEAGDIVQPLASGVLREDDITGDLFDLTRGDRAGRRFYDQITLFKSVGTALEDLAAAKLAVERV